MQNEAKNQEDFEEIFGVAKTMAAAIAACSFSLRETHFRWQHQLFLENLRFFHKLKLLDFYGNAKLAVFTNSPLLRRGE